MIVILILMLVVAAILGSDFIKRKFALWQKARAKARYDVEYKRGYQWAKTARYTEGKTLDVIEMLIDNGLFMDGPNAFDNGAKDGLQIIQEFEANEKVRQCV